MGGVCLAERGGKTWIFYLSVSKEDHLLGQKVSSGKKETTEVGKASSSCFFHRTTA